MVWRGANPEDGRGVFHNNDDNGNDGTKLYKSRLTAALGQKIQRESVSGSIYSGTVRNLGASRPAPGERTLRNLLVGASVLDASDGACWERELPARSCALPSSVMADPCLESKKSVNLNEDQLPAYPGSGLPTKIYQLDLSRLLCCTD